MEDLLKKYDASIKGFKRSEKITAKLLEIGKKSASFDIGGKAEGIVGDAYFQEAREFIKGLKPGDSVTATVMDPETYNGTVLLSLRHAASNSLWEKAEKFKKDSTPINVMVRNVNNAGIVVDWEGINGFIPSSQVGKKAKDKDDLTGNSITVKITEIDKSRKKIVFSEKAVSESANIEAIKKALVKIKEGEIYEGDVVTVTDFGLFVSIKVEKTNIEGLVHVSEIAWNKTEKPSSAFNPGDKVKVKVIGKKDDKLALSIKQAQEDPWKNVSEKFKVEGKGKGKVMRVSDFGAFIEMAPGIEGLVHITKIPPATRLTKGEEVNYYIEEIDPKNKKIALGLVLSSKPVGYK